MMPRSTWARMMICMTISLISLILYHYIDRSGKYESYAFFYAYYEKNQMYKENFQYFLENVVAGQRRDIDFYIIINGECSVPLPRGNPHVKIIRRGNRGYDFGAYSDCVSNHMHHFKYDYYVFLNASARGPIPYDADWIARFRELFETSPDVKLVGVSINMAHLEDVSPHVLSHVQSFFFMMDHEAFLFLKDKQGFFSDEEYLNGVTDIWDIVVRKEIGMSQLILDRGWNINCILSKYRDHDYRKLVDNINTSCDDPYYTGCYFGEDIQPHEAIFHKNSRL